MNKKQLVAKLAGSLNQSKADAERTFDTITNTILDALKADDNLKIAGFGASHSTTILLHHFGLNKYINLIVDDNPLKHGLFGHLNIRDPNNYDS